MKPIKVSEATGAVLDWMVAKAEGCKVLIEDEQIGFERFRTELWGSRYIKHYAPSTDPAQGQPIIERERITTLALDADWEAQIDGPPYPSTQIDGPTQLIAAMRCYCCSKLGDIVDVPEELCQSQKS